MTAGLPEISYEYGFINPLCRGAGRVSLFLILWWMFSKKGSWRVGSGWSAIFGGKILSTTLDFLVGVWYTGTRYWMYFDWEVLPSKEAELKFDVGRPSWLNGMNSHQRKLKLLMQTGQDITTGWGKWVSLWGKPPPLESRWSHHDCDGSWC